MFGGKRRKDFASAGRIIKSESGGAVRSDDPSEHAYVRRQPAAESDELISDQRGAHQPEREGTGQQDDQDQLALDRQVTKPRTHIVSPNNTH